MPVTPAMATPAMPPLERGELALAAAGGAPKDSVADSLALLVVELLVREEVLVLLLLELLLLVLVLLLLLLLVEVVVADEEEEVMVGVSEDVVKGKKELDSRSGRSENGGVGLSVRKVLSGDGMKEGKTTERVFEAPGRDRMGIKVSEGFKGEGEGVPGTMVHGIVIEGIKGIEVGMRRVAGACVPVGAPNEAVPGTVTEGKSSGKEEASITKG